MKSLEPLATSSAQRLSADGRAVFGGGSKWQLGIRVSKISRSLASLRRTKNTPESASTREAGSTTSACSSSPRNQP